MIIAATPQQPNHLRLFDPRLTAGLRDERLARIRCLASRPPRHARSVLGAALTARAAGRVFSAGDGPGSGDGRVNAWSTQTGALLHGAALEAPATCLAVVETVRPAAPIRVGPLKRAGAADGFGCELIVWVGQADGSIAVLTGGDLGLRTVLGGHRGAITCICSPGAPPSAPAVGASVVLSGGEDGAMRIWDARTAECLRSVPGNNAPLRAMLPVWTPDGVGERKTERCRIWSADAERTLCVWEPKRAAHVEASSGPPPPGGRNAQSTRGPKPRQQSEAAREAPAPLTVTLNADVSALVVSTDGTLVCATAGRDGVLVLDGNARLRSRLNANAAAMEAISAVHIVGRGRQLWTGASDGGLALWEREPSPAGEGSLSWAYHCSRRLSSPPLVALRPAAASQVWGACADGTVLVWLSEAAYTEASEQFTRRAFLTDTGHAAAAAAGDVSKSAVHKAIAIPLLRLLRASMDELKRSRNDYSKLLAEVNAGWAQIEVDRQQLTAMQDKLAVALNVETIARIDAEERAASLVKQVDALTYDLSHLGQSRDAALAMKAMKETEVGKLKKAEAKLSMQLKSNEEVGRQLAEARVQVEKVKGERDRYFNEMRHVKRELLDVQKAERAESDALSEETKALAAGLEQRSMETSALTEALRKREASEAAARSELTQLRAAVQNHEEEGARMKHEREQMRQANARMQSLLERLRTKMGQHAGLAHAGHGLSGPMDVEHPPPPPPPTYGYPQHGIEHAAPPPSRGGFSYDGEQMDHRDYQPPPPPQPPGYMPSVEPTPRHDSACASPAHPQTRPPPPSQAWGPRTQQPERGPEAPPLSARRQSAAGPAEAPRCSNAPTVKGGPNCASSQRRPSRVPAPDSTRILKPTMRTTLAGAAARNAAPNTAATPRTAGPTNAATSDGGPHGTAGRTAASGSFGRTHRAALNRMSTQGHEPTPRTAGGGAPPPDTVTRQVAFDAVTPATTRPAAPPDTGGGGGTPRVVEKRSVALLLQLAELKDWLQTCLRRDDLVGDLPTLLEDGNLLLALADVAMPGVAAPLAGHAAVSKIAAFATACQQLGVPAHEVIHPEALLPGPQRSAEAVASALTALAREASARNLLPPLGAR